MRDLDESLARLAADALRGRIRRNERWVLGFQILQLLHQLVEIGVADFGIVEDVIEVFVVANLLAQSLYLFFDVFRGRHRRKIICKEGPPKVIRDRARSLRLRSGQALRYA